MDFSSYGSCGYDIPDQKFMYMRYNLSYDTITNEVGRYEMLHRFLLIFPIIEVDTVGLPYDTAYFYCTAPEKYTYSQLLETAIRVSDFDERYIEWMFSVTPAGDDPDSGRIHLSSTSSSAFYGLSVDTAYDIYVKGRCERQGWSSWSGPMHYDPRSTGIAPATAQPFSLMPNPASGIVTVTTEARQGTLTVTDMQGRQQLTQPLTGPRTAVDIRALAAGTYLVTLTTPDGHSSLKLTVE